MAALLVMTQYILPSAGVGNFSQAEAKKHDLWLHEAKKKKSPAASRIGGCLKRPLPQRQTA